MKNCEAEELLRAAYQVACRNGKDTNWIAFKESLQQELLRINGCDPHSGAEQKILMATCTARTYKVPMYDGDMISNRNEQ